MDSLFDPLLSLEEDFYQEGHALGMADGQYSGRLEGRAFGLEKGYEKFLELGRLQGRASLWKARLPHPQDAAVPKELAITSTRTQKNVETLAILVTNPPFKNDEESVEEIEETLKRGRAKAKVVERSLGEREPETESEEGTGDVDY